MIPIREAIETSAWLRGEYKQPEWHGDFEKGELILFQMRLLDFSKINLASVDNPGRIDPTIGPDANIWLLKLEIVNLCKKPYGLFWIKRQLLIEDNEGFQFAFLDDDHLTLNSNFAKTSGLLSFYSLTLPPKIKRSGSIIFELPELSEDLIIKIKDGSLRET